MAVRRRERGSALFNRTGVRTAPELARELVADARQAAPSERGDGSGIHDVRAVYAGEGAALGSLPEPAVELAPGMERLLDRLGERLGFERASVRMYEAVVRRCEDGEERCPIPLDELRRIREEELGHFHMLVRTLRELGGDPTAMTPSADVSAVLSRGIGEIVHDPRASLDHCLQALLVAELADGDGWTLLCDVARSCGRMDLSERFRGALEAEEEHLMKVRGWLSGLTLEGLPEGDEAGC